MPNRRSSHPNSHFPIMLSLCAAVLVMVLTAPTTATGADWPRWRGSNGDSIATGADLKVSALAGTPTVRWTVELGKGYSAVAVVGSSVYTAGNVSDNDVIYCLDAANGKEKWRHTYACKAASYPGPRATPCVSNGRAYTLSREGQIFCLDAQTGDVLWERNATGLGAKPPHWGFSGSPVVQDNMLLLNLASHGVALDPATGKTIWKSPGGIGGYSTPVVGTIGGVSTIVLFGEKHVFGVDLKTGSKRFEYQWKTSYNINAADPVVDGDRIFISSGYGSGCALLDVSAATPRSIWETKHLANQFSSSILIDGHLYGVDGNKGKGQLACIVLETGTVRWQEKIHFGSLVATGKTLIYLNERGTLYTIEASPEAYKALSVAENVLPRTCWTMPVLCNDALYLRNDSGRLVCLEASKE